MKKAAALMAVVLTLGLTLTLDAEAKRLGGGRSAGMQRQNITAPAKPPAGTGTPAGATNPAAPAASPSAAAAPGAAAAAAPRRSWMGPIAGLAAGLGIAALASHLGMGEMLGNVLTMGLIALAVMALVGFVLRRRAQGPALAGAGTPAPAAVRGAGGSLIGSRIGGGGGFPEASGAARTVPADFDVAAFERNAKDQFLALQSANDARDLARLREYLAPELFDQVREEIQSRGEAPQQTGVFGLQAQVLDVAEEASRYVVSVRFTGSVRDQHGAVPEDLDEVWHLTKPRTGTGGWVVAGIQQTADGIAAAR